MAVEKEMHGTFVKRFSVRIACLLLMVAAPLGSAQVTLCRHSGEALFVEAGGLMYYGSPYADWSAHGAAIVAKILRGARPADIPVERPTNFKLLINSKSAKTLGVAIPESVLLKAQLIETVQP